MSAMILHMLRRHEWDLALRNGSYRPLSLDAEGFIHCSTIEEAIDTANLLFRGATDLLLLRIDETRLAAPLRFEAPAAAGDARPNTRFPHIYGALNLDAVVDAIEFPCAADGSFELPARIREFGVSGTSRGGV
jgi:uncharacterized protein (DUF952 family)